MKALMLCGCCGQKLDDTDTPDGEPSWGICLPCLKLHFPDLHQVITADPAAQAAAGITVTHKGPLDAQ
ncbi:hypothetical protein ES708_27693 [subsurface metagenome]